MIDDAILNEVRKLQAAWRDVPDTNKQFMLTNTGIQFRNKPKEIRLRIAYDPSTGKLSTVNFSGYMYYFTLVVPVNGDMPDLANSYTEKEE